MQFYGRWGLETFLTWDLPWPMRVGLFHRSDYDPSLSGMAGVNVFIPWYILRDGQLDLTELAKHLQQAKDKNHLGGWMKTATAARGELGDVRLRNALVLYRYQNLALQSRYTDRDGWEKEKQDLAFARYLVVPTNDFRAAEKKVETIRQVRMNLRKQLSPESRPDR